jgi:hypothetical protein
VKPLQNTIRCLKISEILINNLPFNVRDYIYKEKERGGTNGMEYSDEASSINQKPKYYRNFIQSGLSPKTLESYDEKLR